MIPMIVLLRILIIIGFTFIGYFLGLHYFSGAWINQFPWLGAVVGALGAFVVVLLDLYFKRLSVRNILSVLLGATIGLWTHSLLMQLIRNYAPVPEDQMREIEM